MIKKENICMKDDLFGEDILADEKKKENNMNVEFENNILNMNKLKIENDEKEDNKNNLYNKFNERNIPGLQFLEYVKKNRFNIWDEYLLTTEEFYENICYLYDLIRNEKIYPSELNYDDHEKNKYNHNKDDSDNDDYFNKGDKKKINKKENLKNFKYNCSKIKNIVSNVPEIYINDLNVESQIEDWCKSFFSREISNNKEIFKTLICYYSKLLASHPCIKYIFRFFFLKYASITTVSTNLGEMNVDICNNDYFVYRLYRLPIYYLLTNEHRNQFLLERNEDKQ